MKIYYKGKFETNDDVKKEHIWQKQYMFNNFYKHQVEEKVPANDVFHIQKELNIMANTNEPTVDQKTIHFLDSLNFAPKYLYQATNLNIIYEIIESESNILYGKELITGLLFPIRDNIKNKYYYYKNSHNCFLERHDSYINPDLARIRYILTKDAVASINEVNAYYIENKTELKIHIKNITQFYNENVFFKKIVEKKQENIQKQSIYTQIIEDIEYLLLSLKQVNINLFKEYDKLYNSIINRMSSTNNINKYSNEDMFDELIDLRANIKLSLHITKRDCSNINDYLNILIEENISNVINNSVSANDININNIDFITDTFLKNNDEYDLITQREVIVKISLLYLLIIKNNIDNYNIEDLKKSYFKDYLKTIIITIYELKNSNIIEDISIDIISENTPNIEFVVDLIRNIKFKNSFKKENIKQLINSCNRK